MSNEQTTSNGEGTKENGTQEQVTTTLKQSSKLGWKKIATFAGVGVVVAASAFLGVKFLRKPGAAQAVADAAQSAADAVAPNA